MLTRKIDAITSFVMVLDSSQSIADFFNIGHVLGPQREFLNRISSLCRMSNAEIEELGLVNCLRRVGQYVKEENLKEVKNIGIIQVPYAFFGKTKDGQNTDEDSMPRPTLFSKFVPDHDNPSVVNKQYILLYNFCYGVYNIATDTYIRNRNFNPYGSDMLADYSLEQIHERNLIPVSLQGEYPNLDILTMYDNMRDLDTYFDRMYSSKEKRNEIMDKYKFLQGKYFLCPQDNQGRNFLPTPEYHEYTSNEVANMMKAAMEAQHSM